MVLHSRTEAAYLERRYPHRGLMLSAGREQCAERQNIRRGQCTCAAWAQRCAQLHGHCARPRPGPARAAHWPRIHPRAGDDPWPSAFSDILSPLCASRSFQPHFYPCGILSQKQCFFWQSTDRRRFGKGPGAAQVEEMRALPEPAFQWWATLDLHRSNMTMRRMLSRERLSPKPRAATGCQSPQTRRPPQGAPALESGCVTHPVSPCRGTSDDTTHILC